VTPYRAGLVLSALLSFCGPLAAQWSYYAGGLGGVSTLSADGRSLFAPGMTSTSLYKPENGPLLSLFAGIHLNDYLSLQGDYTWNRNDLTLVSLVASVQGAPTAYEQTRTSHQHSLFGNLLLYFRRRDSWVRPYLSAGGGAVFLRSEEKRLTNETGMPAPPPSAFHTAKAGFRAAVGIDLSLGRGLQFRYSFAETIQGNEFSRYLWPPGRRNLANFQNLFGIVLRFHRP
jgi:hypothetical protein